MAGFYQNKNPQYEERKSRVSQMYGYDKQNKGTTSSFRDFMPEEDEVFDEGDTGHKFSIRALNFNMMSKLIQSSMLQRASSKLLSSNRHRVTQGSRFNPSVIGKGGNGKASRISRNSKMILTSSLNRDSDIYYNIDDCDEET